MDRDRIFKDAIYEQIYRAARALAHPRRLELVDLLCQGPMTVDSLARKSAMSVGNTSQHLQHLKNAQLVRVQVRGTTRIYRLNDGATCDLFRRLRSYAEQHYSDMQAITQAFLQDRETFEAVDAATLHRRLQEHEVVLLDVRPPEEFAAGHWPGAISMPLEDLSTHMSHLPRNRTIVAYCRGPYCVLALQAVELLRTEGFRAVRLAEGVADWRAQGLPVERDEQTS